MKIIKGISQTTGPIDQPPNSLFYGKNGVINEKAGAWMNEPGFTVSSQNFPYKFNGAIPTYDQIIVFTTDNVHSAIGLYNPDTDIYLPIIDRTDLGFNLNFPITGTAKRDFQGNIIVAFTDNNVSPKYINLGTANNNQDLNDFLLFPNTKYPIYDIKVNDNGGQLKSGVNFIVVQYFNNDGSQSLWSNVSRPISITDDSLNVINGSLNDGTLYDGVAGNTTTTKSISINISNLDTNYDNIRVAAITKINQITSLAPVIVGEFAISGSSIDVIYTGSETSTSVSLDSILINNISYDLVKTMTSLDDTLKIANLSTKTPIDFQKYANNIKIGYTTVLTSAISNVDNNGILAASKIDSTPKGFFHREVYPFYISLILLDNSETEPYIIPGRNALSGDLNISQFATGQAADQGLPADVKKFQIEDTAIPIDATTGTMGYWENKNETNYPSTQKGDFNGTIPYDGHTFNGSPNIPGPTRNLTGTKIKHHRFPSLRYCKINHYPSEPLYGRRLLDILGITVSNVQIPDQIKAKIQGWKIYYGKHTIENSICVGQSLFQFSAYPNFSGTFVNTIDEDKAWTTGGNWYIQNNNTHKHISPYNISNPGGVVGNQGRKSIRFHAFDLVLNKPNIQPSYIINELSLNTFCASALGTPNDTLSLLADYVNFGTTSAVATASGSLLRSINGYRYIPNNYIDTNGVYNKNAESYIHSNIVNGNTLDLVVSQLVSDPPTTTSENSYLTNYCILRYDVYNSYLNQTLIATDKVQIDLTQTTLSNIHGGDTNVSEYSYVTYAARDRDDVVVGSYIKAIHNFICESINNIGLRYQPTSATKYEQYYPKSPSTFMISMDASIDPNNWGYNKDYTSVNDFSSLTPKNNQLPTTNKFPFRIATSIIASREERATSSWKTFKANDYYEQIRDKGEIMFIQNYGSDRLLIQHRNALYITKGNTSLELGDGTKANLGVSDIFSFPPEEISVSKEGRIGCQNMLACSLTKAGYFTVDGELGDIYLYDGEAHLITEGLEVFYRDNLKNIPDNPFNGNGISIAYDEKYERLLLVVKNDTKSFTISYDTRGKSWINCHDYLPDFIFNNRTKLLSYKTQTKSKIYIHNTGKKGIYYNVEDVNPIPYSSFVDVVFTLGKNERNEPITAILESIGWTSEVTNNGVPDYNSTIDFITIRSAYTCTGRVPLTNNIIPLEVNNNNRNTNNSWNFNQVRDLIKNRALAFVQSIFQDYNIIDSNIDQNKAWYDRRLMEDKYFIVRLEFSNKDNKEIFLYDIFGSATRTFK
jgi:hypothetical protein